MDTNKKATAPIIKPKVVLTGKSVDMTKQSSFTLPVIIGIAFVTLAGIVTGYMLSRSKVEGVSISKTGAKTVETEKVIGSMDERFKDEAEGILKQGGIDGEGTHYLERAGGASQYVYLTSLLIPLDDYVDKKVKVWGETNKAQKAGWLMDVGRLEVLE